MINVREIARMLFEPEEDRDSRKKAEQDSLAEEQKFKRQVALEVVKSQLKQKQEQTKPLAPQQQFLGEKYLEQNPGENLSGYSTPYDLLQKKYEAKMLATGGPKFNAVQDKQGNVGYNPKPQQNKSVLEQPEPQVTMGAGGFSQRPVQRNVHGIYEQIKTKESQGQELFPGEKAWAKGYEKKYLGIKESVKVTKDLTSSDRMRIRAVAKDKAIHSRSSDDFADVTEADIQAKIPEATRELFPNMDTANVTTQDVDIKLPKEVKSTSEALKFLIDKQGMTEEEAKQWLKERM